MKSFRSFLKESLLLEAYSRDKTWDNYKDKIEARANEYFPINEYVPISSRSPNDIVYRDDHILASAFRGVRRERNKFSDNPYLKKQQEQEGSIASAIHALFPNKNYKTFEEAVKPEFMDMVERSAPHPKYIPTMVKMYAEGSIKRMEDIETQAAEVFGKYHKLATHNQLDPKLTTFGLKPGTVEPNNEFGDTKGPAHTDFKSMRSLAQVRYVTNHEAYTDLFKQENKALLKGQSTIVHENDKITVYHPHTYEAAKALAFCPHTGKKAAWCTAADSDGGKRMFDHYNRNGPLLIVHPKQPAHAGEMYQLHLGDNQIMDEGDSPAHHVFDPSYDEDKGLDPDNEISGKSYGVYDENKNGGWRIGHAIQYHVQQVLNHPATYHATQETLGHIKHTISRYWTGGENKPEDYGLTHDTIAGATLSHGSHQDMKRMIRSGNYSKGVREGILTYSRRQYENSTQFDPGSYLAKTHQMEPWEQKAMLDDIAPRIFAVAKYQKVIHPEFKEVLLNSHLYNPQKVSPMEIRNAKNFLEQPHEYRSTCTYGNIAHQLNIHSIASHVGTIDKWDESMKD